MRLRGNLPVSVAPVPSCRPEPARAYGTWNRVPAGLSGARVCVREAAGARRARKDTGRPRDRERKREGRHLKEGARERRGRERQKETESERGGERDGAGKRKKRRENARLLYRLRICLVYPARLCVATNDQEDGLTGPSVWPFDTRCVDRLADDDDDDEA